MFKTFRNFPRKKDPANILAQELPPDIFVIDGVNDTSTGMWISPTRNETTDDGTLHIGLMNPFGGAQSTIPEITTGIDNCNWSNPAERNTTPCIAVCSQCDCESVRIEENINLAKQGSSLQYTGSECILETDNGKVCSFKCRLTTGGSLPAIADFPCVTEFTFSCAPDVPGGTVIPPHEVSTIIRAIERFILDLDLNQIQTINPETISSAILRLPIKSKRDWM
jgi:hypothetical protein